MAAAPRFYIFYGADEFTQKEKLAELKSKLGKDPAMVDLNTSYFNGATVRLGELIHACSTVPFLAERRLVVVEGLLEQLGGTGREKEREALLDYLPQLPASTRLILLEGQTLSPQNPFIRLANSTPAGYELAFHIPKGWALERWIAQRVESHGGAIHPHAAALLATDVGEDLRLLEMETRAPLRRPSHSASRVLLVRVWVLPERLLLALAANQGVRLVHLARFYFHTPP